LQKESWAAQVLRESFLAVGASGSGQVFVDRNKSQLNRKLNVQRLAESFGSLFPKEYMKQAIAIMGDEM
jgi:hypothetical protein